MWGSLSGHKSLWVLPHAWMFLREPRGTPPVVPNLDRLSGSRWKDTMAIYPYTLPSLWLLPLCMYVCERERGRIRKWVGEKKKCQAAYLKHKPVDVNSQLSPLPSSFICPPSPNVCVWHILYYFILTYTHLSPPAAPICPVLYTSPAFFLFLSFPVYLSLPSLYCSWSWQRNSSSRWGWVIRAWLRCGRVCLLL